MGKNTKKKDHSPSVVPEVIITEQPDGTSKEHDVISRQPSRERSSRSVSISRLKVGDPLRKDMMFVREKSPFEIGENRNVQLASSKAIIDKALVMDVSGGITVIDEYVSLFFSSGCVIDEAACMDISTQQEIEVVVVEEEENPEIGIMPIELEESKNEKKSSQDSIVVEVTADVKISEIVTDVKPEQESGVESSSVPGEIEIAASDDNRPAAIADPTFDEATVEMIGQSNSEAVKQVEEMIDTHKLEELVESEQKEEKEEENEEKEEEAESESSSSDESYQELVDPALWRDYNSDDDDPSAWFYKKPEEVEAKLTEKEKDDEFRKDRLSKRIPVFLINLKDRSGYFGSELKLQCSVAGLEITVKWLKDGQLVERTSRLQTTAVDGLYSLILKDLSKSDEGTYTAVAKNRGGEISSSAKVSAYEDPSKRVELPTMIKIRDYYHHGLNDLIIECQIMSKPSWVVPDVMWLKGEDPITLDNRVRATYEGNEIFQLNIYNPTLEDSGLYTCVAKNFVGERSISHGVEFTSKVHYIHLPGMHHADKKILSEEELLQKQAQEAILVQERKEARGTSRSQPAPEPYKEESYVIRDSKNKLTWAGQLHNIIAQKGQPVKMICSVNGQQAILKWQKNGKVIDFGDHIKLLNSGVIGQIVITDVAPKDAGEYVCSAKNNYNEIKTACVLKVIELAKLGPSPPTFIKAIKELYNQQTCDLILETQVHGVPNPEIQWFKDGEKIIYDDKLMLNREPNGKYQLRIHKPQAEDCGIYECRAINSDGQAKVKHEVNFSSNEQFVHAHRITHADRFKRQIEDESTLSSSAGGLQTPSQSDESNTTVYVKPVESPEKTEPEQNETQTEEQTTAPTEKPTVDLKSNTTSKPKAMPRRRFDEGLSEPFIIRDSKKKLTWETKLKNITAEEGGEVKFVCIVAGPKPTYKWSKNGKPLVWSKDIINATKAEFGCVRIKNVTASDAAEYTAHAKNSDSEIECSCKLTTFPSMKKAMQTVPTFTRITDYYDIRVNDLVLEVHVRGAPTPTLVWERDGREFKNGMDRVIIAREKDGVYKLSIHDPEKLDGGHWVITAQNSAGDEKVKHHVIFKGKEYYQHVAGIYHADPKLKRDENDEIILPGRSRSVSRAASILSVKSQQREPSTAVTEDALNEASTKEKEHFDDEEEDKMVEKVLKNPQKSEWRQKLSTLYSNELHPILGEPKKPKPLESKQRLYFDAQLKNITVAEGTQVKLICSCVGPSPGIKWFKNNIPLVWSKTLKNESKLGVGAINFVTTTTNDSGTYKCLASNNFGEIETSCVLTVFPLPQNHYVAPSFTRNVREYYNVQVNDLILEVQVRGNPPPSVKWFRDGIELEGIGGEKYFTLREPDGIHKLTIHDPQRKDEGRYMCQVENIAGKESVKHEVKKLIKEDYCHVYGIQYHDPNVMRHGVYEEPPAEATEEREQREFVWLEDGTYYIRGQTPEAFWQYETDTSAESEYEPYESTSADEKEEKKETEEEEKEDDQEDDNEDDEKPQEHEDWEENPPTSIVKHGPKIKKMRKKMYKRPAKSIKSVQSAEESIDQKVTIISDETQQTTEAAVEKNITDGQKETLRKERYLRLFPELVPVPQKPEDSKNALKFITELRDIAVADGGTAKLFCTVIGPKADIKWIKDGEPLEFTKIIKNKSYEGAGIVNISKVSPSDEGTYTVVFKHKDNVITSQAKITIIKKPEHPQGMAPRFITGISQHYDFRIDDLILETTIKGDGLLMVQWYLDGIAIENNEKYIQIREPRGVYKLCIHNPQARDNGRYMIKVKNDFGSEELKYYLRFEGKEKPTYGIFHADPRRQYEDDTVKEEPRKYREVVFLEDGSYYVRGHTPEQFWEWETDTSAESEYEEYVSPDEHEGSVEDEEALEKDEEEEKDAMDANFVLEPQEKPAESIKEEEDEEEEEEEEYEELPKEVKRGPKIKKLRKKVTKTQTKEEPKVTQPPPAPVTLDTPPKVRLSKLVTADHPVEAVISKPKRRPIEVEFISRLRSQTMLKGTTLCLNCCCSDNQKIEVNWFKDGEKFVMNKRCVSDVHFGFITLEIYRTTVEDSGVYECQVKTANGEAKNSCKITVFELPDKQIVEQVPPTFIHPLKETYYPTTNDLHLETRVRGNPVPNLAWFCDGIAIPHSTDKYEIFNQHYYQMGTKITTATLIINDPQMKDSGKYTLVAKNEVQKVPIHRQVTIGLRSESHRKKRIDDIVIENQAPRVNPKLPTPEPVVAIQEDVGSIHEEEEQEKYSEQLEEEEEED